MTVHGWVLGDEYVLHMSDRRLTAARPGAGTQIVDSDAPKTLVVQGGDASFTIGYSGMAETVDGLPVDVLIAQAIAGVELQPGSISSQFTIPNKRFMNHWDIAERVVARLRKELARRGARGEEIVLGLGGYHYRRSGPVLFFRSYQVREAEVFRQSHTKANKNFERRGRCDIAATGSGAQLLLNGVREVLNAEPPRRGSTHENLLLELARVGRGVSSLEPTVGPDFMFTTLTPGPSPHLRVQYVPAVAGVGIEMVGALIDESFTPWVIAPGAVHVPSLIVGHVYSMSGISVEVVPPPCSSGPQGEYDLVGGIFAHPRPRWRKRSAPLRTPGSS